MESRVIWESSESHLESPGNTGGGSSCGVPWRVIWVIWGEECAGWSKGRGLLVVATHVLKARAAKARVAVDDDVAVVERHLVCVLSLVVVDGPEATIFPALRPRLKKETSLIN